MSTLTSDLRTELDADLAGAALDLAEARLLRRQKDSAAHRRTVAEWLDRIDALLDMRLDSAPRAGRPGYQVIPEWFGSGQLPARICTRQPRN